MRNLPKIFLRSFENVALGLFSLPIPEPSRPFIWSVKGNCCKSNHHHEHAPSWSVAVSTRCFQITNSSGTTPRQLVFHPSPIPSVIITQFLVM